MDSILTSLRSDVCSRLCCPATLKHLRRLEFTFYFLYVIFGFACFILPFILDTKKAYVYIIAVFSFAYSIGLYFLRYKIHVPFGLVLHTGTFMIFLGIILIETTLYNVGAILFVLGGLSVGTVFVFLCLGFRIIIVNEPIRCQGDQPEIDRGVVNEAVEENANHEWNIGAEIPEVPVNGNAAPPRQEQENEGGDAAPPMPVEGGGDAAPPMPVEGGGDAAPPLPVDGDGNGDVAPRRPVDEGSEGYRSVFASVFALASKRLSNRQ